MNYLKYKAAKLRDEFRKDGDASEVDPSRVRIQTLKEIEDLQAEANAVKEHAHQRQHAAGGEHRQAALGPGGQLLRAALATATCR